MSVISTFLDRKELHSQFRLWAFGYDMDNMKARCWYDSTMPLYELEGDHRKDFETTTDQCINGAIEARFYLVSALKEAWFDRPADAKGDMSFVEIAFWQDTENDFYDVLHQLANALNQGEESNTAMKGAKQRWHTLIRQQALSLFDQWAVSSAIEYENPRRIAVAHNKLVMQLNGKKLREKTLSLPLKTKPSEGVAYESI